MKKILLLLLILSCSIPEAFTQPTNKKLLKKEKRFIHPKSKYFSFSNGWGFTSILTKDPNNFLNQGLQMRNNSFVPSVMYEYGIKNNFFTEIGYSSVRQGIFYGRQVGLRSFSSYNSQHKNHNLQLGGGYRVINKNNFHFLNFHAGIFIGIANTKVSDLLKSYGRKRKDFITNYAYTVNININEFKPIAFGTYLGISKELRLSKDVRFFVKYIQQFGFKNTISGTFKLSSNQINFANEPATFKVRGGGAFITGGLKILLFKNQLK